MIEVEKCNDEREAIEDIEKLRGKKVKFHPYNTHANYNSIGGPWGGLAGGIIGGVATSGAFALADFSEKEAIKGETTMSDVKELYADTASGGLGALAKPGLGAAGVKVADDVVVDAAIDIGTGGAYETVKPVVMSGGEENG